MAIAVTCACGESFKVKNESASKKIKCPACHAIVQARPKEEDDEPATKGAESDAPDGQPRKEGKKKKKKPSKQSSRTMLYLLIGGGALVLGLCCAGVGVGGVIFYLSLPGDPEKEIVGKWQFDGDYGSHMTLGDPPPTMHFNQDNSFELIPQNRPAEVGKGKWKTLSKSGNTIKVEISYTIVTGNSKRTVTTPLEFIVISRQVLHKPFQHNFVVNGQQIQNNSGQRYRRI